MITHLLELLFTSFFCGVIAVVYRRVLAYEPILNWWFMFGNKFEKRWFFNPIWGCTRCISGQLGLWSFLLLLLPLWLRGHDNTSILFMLFSIIANICTSIFFTALIDGEQSKENE